MTRLSRYTLVGILRPPDSPAMLVMIDTHGGIWVITYVRWASGHSPQPWSPAKRARGQHERMAWPRLLGGDRGRGLAEERLKMVAIGLAPPRSAS